MSMNNRHFLLLSFPFHSHLNPTLRLATKLTAAGAQVTISTTVNGLNNLKTRPSALTGISYHSFTDGYEGSSYDIAKPGCYQEIKSLGSNNLKRLLVTKDKEGQKIEFIIYGLCLPWVAQVAREFHVPSAFFYFQSAASFSLVYHLGLLNTSVELDPTGTVEIPGLPLLKYSEIPEVFIPPHQLAPVFQEHMQTLEKHANPILLINTFEGLEEESVKAIPNDRINIFSVGPLVPDGKSGQDSGRENYLRWLDSKREKSVIYVSFGSLAELHKTQKEEIFHGLIELGHPFLWVLRGDGDEDEAVKNYTAEYDGVIVRWCLQAEVLNHPAVGCFLTHCGWNSMVESVVGGVPVVGCPQFADQMLNAKMAEEVWGNGVTAVVDGGGVVGRKEIKRCLEVVLGPGGEIMRTTCQKLKCMAMKAMSEGGSQHRDLDHLFERLNSV